MELYLRRKILTKVSTIGELTDGKKSWFTIEDCDRGLSQKMPLSDIQAKKKYGITAIPEGRYKVVITKSNRFSAIRGKDVFTPQLLDVPGYEGIRIHPANFASELEGCIAPGKQKGVDKVINSRPAYQEVVDAISQAIRAGEEVYINITNIHNVTD